MEIRKCKFGHETGVIILIGLGVSGILFSFNNAHIKESLTANLLFRVCLPLILFAEGYNMHRDIFRKEITNAIMLGILCVFVTFLLHFGGTYWWMTTFGINATTHSYDYNEDGTFDHEHETSVTTNDIGNSFFSIP